MEGYKDLLEEETEGEEKEVKSKEEMWKPCLYIDSKQDPSVESLKLGEKVTKEFRVRSRTENEEKGKKTYSVELELI